MKHRVQYSTTSWILTLILMGALGVGLEATRGDGMSFYTLLVITLSLLICAYLYAPLWICADEENLQLQTPFRSKRIPMAEVASVERYRPMPGTIRTCASGGFFGYWGAFRDNCIGNYTGFYGKNDDCFLVTLRTGKKYLLSCEESDQTIDFISRHIAK